MPLALITLGCAASADVQKEIATEAMTILSNVIGKPVSYCSAHVVLSVGGMGGSVKNTAFVDVRSIGGLKGKQEALSSAFAALLKKKVAIEGANVSVPRVIHPQVHELHGGLRQQLGLRRLDVLSDRSLRFRRVLRRKPPCGRCRHGGPPPPD